MQNRALAAPRILRGRPARAAIRRTPIIPILHQRDPLGYFNSLLLLDDGATLYDSRVIVEYLDALAPQPRLIPEQARQRADVRTLEALADGIMDAAVTARLELVWPGRAAGERSAAWVQRQSAKIDAAVQALGERLGEREYLFGDGLSLADIAAVVALDYLSFRLPENPWRDRQPGLARFCDRLDSREPFHETLAPGT